MEYLRNDVGNIMRDSCCQQTGVAGRTCTPVIVKYHIEVVYKDIKHPRLNKQYPLTSHGSVHLNVEALLQKKLARYGVKVEYPNSGIVAEILSCK